MTRGRIGELRFLLFPLVKIWEILAFPRMDLFDFGGYRGRISFLRGNWIYLFDFRGSGLRDFSIIRTDLELIIMYKWEYNTMRENL